MYTIILVILQSLFIIIPILVLVAVFTLFERKIIGYTQRRKGPNKVGVLGFLQPFADGLKLMMKEPLIPTNSNFFLYIFAPILTLLLSMVSWILIPFEKGVVICDLNLGLLFILGISSLNVYGIILAGWSSNSTYAFLGALRSSAQMISYEVSLGLILITVLLPVGSFNLTDVVLFQEDIWFFIPFFPLFILFFISSIAETNRHPFDLPEAEAELVSGYNVEYASVGFAFFFIGEYANILLMSGLNVIIFFGGWLPLPLFGYLNLPHYFWFFFKLMCFVFFYIIIRAMLPRFRYDQLMNLGWKVFLPISLGFFVFYFGVLYGLGWNP